MRFSDSTDPIRPTRQGFALDRSRGRLLGVCAGIASYFALDVTLVRIAWVLATIFGFGSLVLVYLAIALIAE